jgi:hypothetical protein
MPRIVIPNPPADDNSTPPDDGSEWDGAVDPWVLLPVEEQQARSRAAVQRAFAELGVQRKGGRPDAL